MTTPAPTDVLRVLGLLGTTPTAVAQTLAAKGIHGKRRDGANCPISVYLRQQFPEADTIWTGTYVIELDEDGDVELTLPFPIRAFRTHFDGDTGEYPELVA